MSLLEEIKTDQLSARRNRKTEKATLLTTLYSEAANVGLNDGKRVTTDDEVIAVVRKFLKNVHETWDALPDTIPREQEKALLNEKRLYELYLPKQIPEDKLADIIRQIVANHDNANMGVVMRELKAHHAGEYDGKTASSLAKTILA